MIQHNVTKERLQERHAMIDGMELVILVKIAKTMTPVRLCIFAIRRGRRIDLILTLLLARSNMFSDRT